MGNATLFKLSLVILRLVEPYDSSNFQMLKYFGVAGGGVTIARLLTLITVDRSHEGDELPRDNPVQITIFNFLIMLILSGVELIKVVPFLF